MANTMIAEYHWLINTWPERLICGLLGYKERSSKYDLDVGHVDRAELVSRQEIDLDYTLE